MTCHRLLHIVKFNKREVYTPLGCRRDSCLKNRRTRYAKLLLPYHADIPRAPDCIDASLYIFIQYASDRYFVYVEWGWVTESSFEQQPSCKNTSEFSCVMHVLNTCVTQFWFVSLWNLQRLVIQTRQPVKVSTLELRFSENNNQPLTNPEDNL